MVERKPKIRGGGFIDMLIQGVAELGSGGIGGTGGPSTPRKLTQEEKNEQIHEEIKKKITELKQQRYNAAVSLDETVKELEKRPTMNPFIKKIKSTLLLTNQNLAHNKNFYINRLNDINGEITRLSNIYTLITNIKNKKPGETIPLSQYIMYKRIARLNQRSNSSNPKKVIIAKPEKIQTEFGEFRINTGEIHAYLTDNKGLSGIHPHSAQIVEHHTLLEKLRNPKSTNALIHPIKGHHFYVPHPTEPHIKPGNLHVMGPDGKTSLYYLHHKNPNPQPKKSGQSGSIKMRPH